MAIVLTIEVTPTGMHAARDEIHAFLAHESTRPEAAASLAYVVLRKLVMQIDQVERQQERERRDIEARKPKPTIRDLRRVA